jgi:hypothetical protein
LPAGEERGEYSGKQRKSPHKEGCLIVPISTVLTGINRCILGLWRGQAGRPQQRAMISPKASGLFRLLWRNSNSLT